MWTDGPLNKLGLKAMDYDLVGMQACWFGDFYGDANYEHSPVPGQIDGDNPEDNAVVGMHIWYATSPTSFEQYAWRHGDLDWQRQQTFSGFNGHAGVGCYSWGPGTVSYVFMVNLQSAVEIWWKDTNSSLTGNTSHPINVYTNTSVTIPNVNFNTSLGYTNILYAQNPQNPNSPLTNTNSGPAPAWSISGYNISWAAENTSVVMEDTFTITGGIGLPSTHLSVTTLPDRSGGDSLLAFFQTEGDDITAFTRGKPDLIRDAAKGRSG